MQYLVTTQSLMYFLGKSSLPFHFQGQCPSPGSPHPTLVSPFQPAVRSKHKIQILTSLLKNRKIQRTGPPFPQSYNLATVGRNQSAAGPYMGPAVPPLTAGAWLALRAPLGKIEKSMYSSSRGSPTQSAQFGQASKGWMDFSHHAPTGLSCLMRGPASMTKGTSCATTTNAVVSCLGLCRPRDLKCPE